MLVVEVLAEGRDDPLLERIEPAGARDPDLPGAVGPIAGLEAVLGDGADPDLHRIERHDGQDVQEEIGQRPRRHRVERQQGELGDRDGQEGRRQPPEVGGGQGPPRRHRVGLPVGLEVLEKALQRGDEEEVLDEAAHDLAPGRARLAEDQIRVAVGVQVEVVVHVRLAVAGARVAEEVRAHVAEEPVEARIAEERAVIALVHELGGAVEVADGQQHAETVHPPPWKEAHEDGQGREGGERGDHVQRAAPIPEPVRGPQGIQA